MTDGLIKAPVLTCAVFFCSLALAAGAEPDDDLLVREKGHVCPPCYHVTDVFDTEVYDHEGQCPICGMDLIEQPRLQDVDQVHIHSGSGNFLLEQGLGRPDKPIIVFYHKPVGFSPDSPILLVIPGAGRDAWEYRDAWTGASEEYGVLVLAPAYAADQYDFAAYHMGGVAFSVEFRGVDTEDPKGKRSEYTLSDEDIVIEVSEDPDEWIFNDFDLIFDRAVAATGSQQGAYDIFGHSAGGQILHRMAIFKPDARADRILAANSGFYTLPVRETGLPFGLEGTPVSDEDLAGAFSANLVVFLGEDDNESETRGTMLHTPTADRQGLGRLSRGQYFYRNSRQKAESIGAEFNWRLEVIENVGHDHQLMGRAAADYLYGDGSSRRE